MLMGHEELLCMLELLHADGTWLLLKRTPEETNSAEKFLKIREKWEREELAVLDFDGELHPVQPFARLMYNIRYAEASMRYDAEGITEIYVKGPVDLTHLYRNEDGWKLELSEASQMMNRCRENLLEKRTGTLTTCGTEEGKLVEKQADLEGCQDVCRVLAEHLALYYREESLCRRQ